MDQSDTNMNVAQILQYVQLGGIHTHIYNNEDGK